MVTPQNPAANQVTGAEDDFSSFVRQAIQEEMAKGQQVPNPGAAPSTQIPLTLNGQTVTFNSPEELSTAVSSLVQSLQTQQQAPQYVAPAPQVAEVTGKDDPFDVSTFVQKMTSNPLDAFDYADKYRFGVDNPSAAIKDAIASKAKLDDMSKVLTVYQFRDAHPEFQGSPQAGQVIEQVMQQGNYPLTTNGLEAAYALAITRGLLPNYYAHQGQQGQAPQQSPFQPAQPQFQQNPYAQNQPQGQAYQNFPQHNFQGGRDPRFFNGGANFAPPSVPRGGVGGNEPDFGSIAENLSTDQIEAVFSRFAQ